MTCYIKLHPWDAFLKARLGAILFFLSQGKSLEKIATTLSMDADQVGSIIKSNRDLCTQKRHKDFNKSCFFYTYYSEEEKELDE